jgi:NAD(P)H dehydrogenase (quinone)
VNTILITGASGRVGRRTAELLASRGYPLRLMTRTPQRAPDLSNASVLRGDFAEPTTLDVAFAGVDVALVVSASGKPMERAQLHRNAFTAAAQARVRHVIYLSLQGAAPSSKYPFSRDHYLSEQYLAATGLPHTILRNAFYLDMFLEKFDDEGVIRGPARQTRAAYVSREDAARTAASVLLDPPGGIHDVTGPEALSITDIARRLSVLVFRRLRYQKESVASARERLSQVVQESWQVDLLVGWFEAIAAGELEAISDTVIRYTGRKPLGLEDYFSSFPKLLRQLRLTLDQRSGVDEI